MGLLSSISIYPHKTQATPFTCTPSAIILSAPPDPSNPWLHFKIRYFVTIVHLLIYQSCQCSKDVATFCWIHRLHKQHDVCESSICPVGCASVPYLSIRCAGSATCLIKGALYTPQPLSSMTFCHWLSLSKKQLSTRWKILPQIELL